MVCKYILKIRRVLRLSQKSSWYLNSCCFLRWVFSLSALGSTYLSRGLVSSLYFTVHVKRVAICVNLFWLVLCKNQHHHRLCSVASDQTPINSSVKDHRMCRHRQPVALPVVTRHSCKQWTISYDFLGEFCFLGFMGLFQAYPSCSINFQAPKVGFSCYDLYCNLFLPIVI